jgi:hypothetical protein
MRTYESFLALIQELEGDAADLERRLARNRTAWELLEHGADDPVDWGETSTVKTWTPTKRLTSSAP